MYQQLLKEYLLEIKIKGYSLRTIETYRRNNTIFTEWYVDEFESNCFVEDIRKIHLKAYISYLLDKGYKKTYINTILKSIKTFFVYLIEEEIIRKNPLDEIKLLKEDEQILVSFTKAEVNRMLNVWKFDSFLGARNKCIIATFLDTGIRLSELRGIKNEDISIDGSFIKIHGKGGKWRIVPLSDSLKYYIMKYQRIRDKHFNSMREPRNGKDRVIEPYLFLNKSGSNIKSNALVEIMFRETGKLAGVRDTVRCSPHTLRHYYAVMNLNTGQDIHTISKILGHKNLNTTQIYLQSISNEDLMEKAIQHSPLEDL